MEFVKGTFSVGLTSILSYFGDHRVTSFMSITIIEQEKI